MIDYKAHYRKVGNLLKIAEHSEDDFYSIYKRILDDKSFDPVEMSDNFDMKYCKKQVLEKLNKISKYRGVSGIRLDAGKVVFWRNLITSGGATMCDMLDSISDDDLFHLLRDPMFKWWYYIFRENGCGRGGRVTKGFVAKLYNTRRHALFSSSDDLFLGED